MGILRAERMNIFEEIRAAWAAKSTVEAIVKEAKQMNAVGKPAWKTTEFYFNLASQIATLWGAVHGFIPPQYAAIISIAGIAVYTVARTIAKAITDIQNVKAGTPVAVIDTPSTTK